MNTNLSIKRIINATTVPGDADHHAAKCYLISLHVLAPLKITGATSAIAAKTRYGAEYLNQVKKRLSDLCALGPINTALCLSQCYSIYQYYSLSYRDTIGNFYYLMGNPVFLAKYADISHRFAVKEWTTADESITIKNIVSFWKSCIPASERCDMANAADTCKILLNSNVPVNDLMVADHINPRSMVKSILISIEGIAGRLAEISMSRPDEVIAGTERAKATAFIGIYRQAVEDILLGMRTLDASGQDRMQHLGFYLATKMLMNERVADWAAAMALDFAKTDVFPENTKVLTPREYLNL